MSAWRTARLPDGRVVECLQVDVAERRDDGYVCDVVVGIDGALLETIRVFVPEQEANHE